MFKITNFQEAEKALAKYIPMVREITGKDITLCRMVPLMAVFGNPEKRLKIIHIAGTSGKTSTTYYISALLKSVGKKVGTTVSPHIDSVAERVQINLEPLGEAEFSDALEKFLKIITESKQNPTYFELLIGFVYWYFANAKVDYAVIETGLGGLQDGTNVAGEPNKVCVITDLGYDHMKVLGDSLQEIALQKAGIIHPNNETLMYSQPDVNQIFRDWCNDHEARLHLHDQAKLQKSFADFESLNLLPEFQQRNFLLAYQTFLFLQRRDSLDNISEQGLRLVMNTHVPARMDKKIVGSKTIIMDGAHNAQKMKAFIDSLQEQYDGIKTTILLGLKTGKEYKDVLPLLKPVTNLLIITEFNVTQDIPVRAIESAKLAKEAERIGMRVVVQPNQDKAYELLMSQPQEEVIITGSFYLIAQLRGKHQELRDA